MKKLLGILLLSCICIMNSEAQSQINDEVIKNKLINILELKHKYEEAQYKMSDPRSANSNANEYRASYINAIKAIKEVSVKGKYLSYINKTLKKGFQPNDKTMESVYLYNWVSPLSSYLDKNNPISYLDYLKIVRYCIFEQNSDTLLPLKEIAHLKKK